MAGPYVADPFIAIVRSLHFMTGLYIPDMQQVPQQIVGQSAVPVKPTDVFRENIYTTDHENGRNTEARQFEMFQNSRDNAETRMLAHGEMTNYGRDSSGRNQIV